MSQPSPRLPLFSHPGRLLLRFAVALGAVALVVLTAGVAWRLATANPFGRPPAPPRVTHDIVVQQVRDVAKLVSTETTMRDVVVYEQTRYLATKRVLLVVTGRVLAGIDLERGVDVQVDDAARRIRVSIPPAEIVSVDVVNVRTYDEQAGLLNPWRPADRDEIQRRVRAQLVTAAEQSGMLARADRSAEQVLRTLLARDGYVVEIVRAPVVRTPTG